MLRIEAASSMEVEINQSSNLLNREFQNTVHTTNPSTSKENNNSSPKSLSQPLEEISKTPFAVIIEQLSVNNEVLCKSQQRDEQDITKDEKVKILTEIFEKSKSNFLSRFGQFLTSEQAQLFEQFQNDAEEGYEITFHLRNVAQMHSDRIRHKKLRNKRYAALKRLVDKDSYFSEIEMMRRNPLLYEQLVGRYLSAAERKRRDRQAGQVKTFVGVLMDGIDTERAEAKRKKQEAAEDAAIEEEDSDSDSDNSDESIFESKSAAKQRKKGKPSRLFWGEIQDDEVPVKIKPPMKDSELSITAQERKLLKEEFVSSMYQSFLDGKDDEFDYDTIDNNDEYDNLEILANDEEEKYFDSEEPEDMTMCDDSHNAKEESSEDELDIYMSALNQHPVVCQLSEDMKKL